MESQETVLGIVWKMWTVCSLLDPTDTILSGRENDNNTCSDRWGWKIRSLLSFANTVPAGESLVDFPGGLAFKPAEKRLLWEGTGLLWVVTEDQSFFSAMDIAFSEPEGPAVTHSLFPIKFLFNKD
ncbi:hypothetical protein CapIbe_023750 [Capra ibex]